MRKPNIWKMGIIIHNYLEHFLMRIIIKPNLQYRFINKKVIELI